MPPRARSKKGRSPFGVAGRTAASLPDYSNDSDALKASKWQWTPAQLKTSLSQSSVTKPRCLTRLLRVYGNCRNYGGLAQRNGSPMRPAPCRDLAPLPNVLSAKSFPCRTRRSCACDGHPWAAREDHPCSVLASGVRW
ncbi:cytochrome C2 [Xanthomonas fragariae LMG 25863]|nr:cytochrome C2 [Xanthomonas fragariae LMG 25863]